MKKYECRQRHLTNLFSETMNYGIHINDLITEIFQQTEKFNRSLMKQSEYIYIE